jgi:hypothetical protein
MSTPIQPSTEITTRIITSFTVSVIRLELFTSVTVNAMLYGADGGFIEVKTLTLSGQDYLDWNNNDQYLINKVAEILGFTIVTPIPDPPIPEPPVPEPTPDPVVPEPTPDPVVPEPTPDPVVPEPTPELVVPEPTPEPTPEPVVPEPTPEPTPDPVVPEPTV